MLRHIIINDCSIWSLNRKFERCSDHDNIISHLLETNQRSLGVGTRVGDFVVLQTDGILQGPAGYDFHFIAIAFSNGMNFLLKYDN